MKRFRLFGTLFKHFRMRVFSLGQENQPKGDQRRDAQDGKAEAVGGEQVAGAFDGGDDKQHDGAEEGTELVQKFLVGKALSRAHFTGRKAHQRIFCRFFNGFADSFGNDESACNHPAVFRYQRQGGDRQHLQAIAHHDQRPVFFGLVGDKSREQSQRIATQFSESGHKSENMLTIPMSKINDIAPLIRFFLSLRNVSFIASTTFLITWYYPFSTFVTGTPQG